MLMLETIISEGFLDGLKKGIDDNKSKTFNTAVNNIYKQALNNIYVLNTNKHQIKKVIFNDPATIIIWDDGTKTVVRASDEAYDPEKGLAMCLAKKFLGNKGNYYNTIRKYLNEYYEQEAELMSTASDIFDRFFKAANKGLGLSK